MLRIRFPDGQCVQYNDATGHHYDNRGGIEIVRKQGETSYWVALIPPGANCIVEHVQPCSVTNPLAPEMTPESALALVMKHLRTLPCYSVRDLKSALRDFNARRRSWRS